MEAGMNVDRWRPSSTLSERQSPTAKELQTLATDLTTQTVGLLKHPYDPRIWLARARTLERLGYTELVVGDTYKSILLCRLLLAQQDKDKRYRLGFRCSFWMIDDVGEEGNDDFERRYAMLQAESHRVQVRNLCYWPAREEGAYFARRYPWMHDRHSRRSDELVKSLNEELAAKAPKQSPVGPCCEVRTSAFGTGDDDDGVVVDDSDILGMFATQDIPKDCTILYDRTRTFGCKGPSPGQPQITSGCTDLLHPNLATDEVGQDLRWIRDRVENRCQEAILMCRFLLCTIQDTTSHPLDHPLIARLTPNRDPSECAFFSLEADISIPNTFLMQQGIDIFADLAYDSWVLFTIASRVDNNSWTNPIHICVHPSFSLFNHSCEPNVEWITRDRPVSMLLRARVKIAKGEQLFVEYDGYMADKSVRERRKRLRRWLSYDCRCTRCVNEEEGMASEDEQKEEGQGFPAAWDTSPKISFPEDLVDAVDAAC